MALRNDGKLGIGIADPQATLDVSGSMRARGNVQIDAGFNLFFGLEEWFGGSDLGGGDYGYIYYANDDNPYAYWGDSGENGALIIGTQNDGPNFNGDSLVLKGAAANIFDSPYHLFVSGNVGIGTTTPGAKFEVAGGSLGIGAGSEVELSRFWLKSENYDTLRVYSRRRQPGGDWSTSDMMIQRRVDASDMGYVKFTEWDLAFGVGATEAIRVKESGNVGIGTPNVTHKLTVNGTIRAKEVIVEANWADYVFAEDYRLAPLSEVEAHIKAHKHLPDMPSAAEVAEKGVSMGEMQARMMAKIEEVTLHMIELKKENAKLRREVDALKSGAFP